MWRKYSKASASETTGEGCIGLIAEKYRKKG